jgi:hypothetical protein
MNKIVLTEEQVQVLRQASAPVAVCHPQGTVLGTVDPELTPEFIAEMKRRAASAGPWYTGEQMRKHLQALQEAWDLEGGFDEARMWELLEQIRATDQK